MNKLTYLPPELNNIVRLFYVEDFDFICLFIKLISINTEETTFDYLRKNKHCSVYILDRWVVIKQENNHIKIIQTDGYYYPFENDITIKDDFTQQMHEWTEEFENPSIYCYRMKCLLEVIKREFLKVQKYKADIELLLT